MLRGENGPGRCEGLTLHDRVVSPLQRLLQRGLTGASGFFFYYYYSFLTLFS